MGGGGLAVRRGAALSRTFRRSFKEPVNVLPFWSSDVVAHPPAHVSLGLVLLIGLGGIRAARNSRRFGRDNEGQRSLAPHKRFLPPTRRPKKKKHQRDQSSRAAFSRRVMSSFVRDAPATSAATSAAATSAATSTSTTSTSTAAAASGNKSNNSKNNNSNNSNSGSPSGSSSGSPEDGSSNARGGRKAHSSAAAASTRDGSSSPLRRLPSVLRPPARSSGASASSSTATSTTQAASSAAASRSQTQPQGSAGAAGNRDLTGMNRRLLYTAQAMAGSYGASPGGGEGAASPAAMQMQRQQYFGSEAGGRLTTGLSSYNHNRHLSPVSSPAMAGASWAQSATAGAAMAGRGVKRHLQQPYDAPMYDTYGMRTGSSVGGSSTSGMGMRMPLPGMQQSAPASNGASMGGAGRIRSAQQQQTYGMPPNEDPMQYEPSGEARHPRDSTRYETWTSKQLRKKCSHLKLRGLKNVKKHVMVEALYRYYRNQRLKDMADAASAKGSGGKSVTSQPQLASPQQQQQQQRRMDARRPGSIAGSSGSRSDLQYRSRYDQRSAGTPSQSQYGSQATRPRSYVNYGSQSPSPPSSGGDSGGSSHPQRPGASASTKSGYYLDEESKGESQYKEVPVTSEDVIRLVDVVLSPEFVDRLAAELSRWQFWVDVREMYIALLNRQHPPRSAGAGGDGGPVGTGGSATNSRNFKWSSMQLWEIWKELSFAYTKTCFEFTAAGMNKRVDDREYINFCDGRPDVYYLHQRLHSRPDLLHQIKSNEYIDEKCTSEASESIALEQQRAQQQQQQGPLMGTGSPLLRGHKRYKRTAPMTGAGPVSAAYNSARAIAAFRDGTAAVDGTGAANGGNSGDNGSGQGSGDSRGHSPEENSTENSETTGEDGSNSNTANSNASNSSQDVSMRAALAEQKYFGLLLQNFEVIFESLHNKKVLLATLRKDNKAPDHLIADLHDDIHVLSALKKEFRNKLRRTMQ
ncbi:hypothetical protein PF008_g18773 [Phytophthora fragariae]|uniref:Uncharacterized protein n=1 Tax=Phytophthora fragariae TaxID=53985 RepID=A0A6G0R4C4_9STRA|nr:hypothetical protein PF008_g18773 [Phytophthora fragariae]